MTSSCHYRRKDPMDSTRFGHSLDLPSQENLRLLLPRRLAPRRALLRRLLQPKKFCPLVTLMTTTRTECRRWRRSPSCASRPIWAVRSRLASPWPASPCTNTMAVALQRRHYPGFAVAARVLATAARAWVAASTPQSSRDRTSSQRATPVVLDFRPPRPFRPPLLLPPRPRPPRPPGPPRPRLTLLTCLLHLR